MEEGFVDGSATADEGAEYAIRVAVRVRPVLPKEKEESLQECVHISTEHSQVVVGKSCFTFDHIFGSDASQEQVYEEAALPLIEGVGAGLNATLLAYGQTSAGKTFTLGSCNPLVPKDQQGIIPRFVNALFRDLIYAKKVDIEMVVRVSFVELHNEDINDLLDPRTSERSTTDKGEALQARRKSVSMREDPQQGVVVVGIKEVEVRKPAELLRCLEKGTMLRTTAATNMNEASSRSHAIFSVIVEQRSQATGAVTAAKVRFADLAGSERAKKSGTVGERFKEGVCINQGLLALGNVISALGDPRLHRSHVPYRDSKLTRMLQDSLGGNSRTLMLACVSPSMYNMAETLNTLKYANRAKNIKNKVCANVSKIDDTLALKDRIQELQAELQRERQLRFSAPSQLSSEGEDSLPATDSHSTRETADRTILDRLQMVEEENRRLREELSETKRRLVEAAEDALDCRKRLENRPSPTVWRVQPDEAHQAATPGPDACAGSPIAQSPQPQVEIGKQCYGSEEDKVRILQSYLEGALASCAEQDEEAFPLESHDEGEIDFQVGEPFEPQVEDADIEAEVAEQQSRLEEDLAHAEEDAREEEQYLKNRRELEYTIEELDELIRDKVELMEQLSKQSRAFNSMKARYELRLEELRKAVHRVGEEKEELQKEVQQLTVQGPVGTPDMNKRSEGRRAQLEGRLKEVSRQLSQLKRHEVEAQRLLRLKEQQSTQIEKLQEEILKLRGQKEVVQMRMKEEEQEQRIWKKKWSDHLKELERQNKKQGKLLQQKVVEAAQTARKVEVLKQNQQHLVEMARRKAEMEHENGRAARLREANARLQRALRDREKRVRQLEAMIARRTMPGELPGQMPVWNCDITSPDDMPVLGMWLTPEQWPKLKGALGWLKGTSRRKCSESHKHAASS
mmetsp:Transcript_43650/g.100706  ORF Transcript_43650/g.100706 Transcript_43650/m.100706 type:complete len:911 (+) Transcript_43650:47-2779(+)